MVELLTFFSGGLLLINSSIMACASFLTLWTKYIKNIRKMLKVSRRRKPTALFTKRVDIDWPCLSCRLFNISWKANTQKYLQNCFYKLIVVIFFSITLIHSDISVKKILLLWLSNSNSDLYPFHWQVWRIHLTHSSNSIHFIRVLWSTYFFVCRMF